MTVTFHWICNYCLDRMQKDHKMSIAVDSRQVKVCEQCNRIILCKEITLYGNHNSIRQSLEHLKYARKVEEKFEWEFAKAKMLEGLLKPKEESMAKKDEVTIKKENLQNAYDKACPEYKKALENLFPGECKEKPVFDCFHLHTILSEKGYTDYWMVVHEPKCGFILRMINNNFHQGFNGHHSSLQELTNIINRDYPERFRLCSDAKITVKE